MKESGLVALVRFRQELNEKVFHLKEPILASQENEIKELKEFSKALQERIEENEEAFEKDREMMKKEIDGKDAEILKLNAKLKVKNSSIKKLEAEVTRLSSLLSQNESEKQSLTTFYDEQISDLKLKHDQEIYILKKIKNIKQ